MKFLSPRSATLAIVLILAGCSTGLDPVAPRSTLDSSPPQAPLGLTTATNSAGNRILSWTPNSESDLGSYQIYQYSPDPSRDNAYVLAATVGSSAAEWNLPGATEPEVTWLRVRAVDRSGNRSAESAPLQVTLLPPGAGYEIPAEDANPRRH